MHKDINSWKHDNLRFFLNVVSAFIIKINLVKVIKKLRAMANWSKAKTVSVRGKAGIVVDK